VPGSIYWPRCRDCGLEQEIHTGTSVDWESGRPWTYIQMVCDSCTVLVSCRQFDEDRSLDPGACLRCGSELRLWEGRTWHERRSDGFTGAEHVEGPCPACGAAISNDREGGDIIRIALWD